MAETVDDSFLRANEAIAALKKTRPRSVTEARNRAVELSRLNGILSKATKEVAETQAQARVATGNGTRPTPSDVQPTQVVATELSEDLINSLAKGIVGVVKPLKERVAKLEGGARKVETHRAVAWVCEEPNTNDNLSCDGCGVYGMRAGPVLLDKVWLAIARRPAEYLCGACVQQRCRDRLGRELSGNDLRGCDANRAWSAILRSTAS